METAIILFHYEEQNNNYDYCIKIVNFHENRIYLNCISIKTS